MSTSVTHDFISYLLKYASTLGPVGPNPNEKVKIQS